MPAASLIANAIGQTGNMYMQYRAGNEQVGAAQQAQLLSNQATDKALRMQQQMYTQNRADLAPWRTAGTSALSTMQNGLAKGGQFSKPFTMADYQADPGYAFRQQQGMNALQNSAAARGGLLSGNTLRGIQDYSQGLASQEYQNAYNRYNQQITDKWNRYAGLANVGQTASTQQVGMSSNLANTYGNALMNNAANQANASFSAANARASQYAGMGQSMANIGQSFSNYFGGGGMGGGMGGMGGGK